MAAPAGAWHGCPTCDCASFVEEGKDRPHCEHCDGLPEFVGLLGPPFWIRCVQCRTEFDPADLVEVDGGCPKCGSLAVPLTSKEDLKLIGKNGRTILNWHELRLLLVWARNWADATDEGEERIQHLAVVDSIAANLKLAWPQHPLTLADEVNEYKKAYGNDVQLYRGDGTKIDVPPPFWTDLQLGQTDDSHE